MDERAKLYSILDYLLWLISGFTKLLKPRQVEISLARLGDRALGRRQHSHKIIIFLLVMHGWYSAIFSCQLTSIRLAAHMETITGVSHTTSETTRSGTVTISGSLSVVVINSSKSSVPSLRIPNVFSKKCSWLSLSLRRIPAEGGAWLFFFRPAGLVACICR